MLEIVNFSVNLLLFWNLKPPLIERKIFFEEIIISKEFYFHPQNDHNKPEEENFSWL